MTRRLAALLFLLAPLLVASPHAGGRQAPAPLPPGNTIPIVDLASDSARQVIVDREEGQYLGHVTTVLLEDGKTNEWDSAYPGVEVLPDGTIVTTTYGHWTVGQPPYIVSIRLRLDELDGRVQR